MKFYVVTIHTDDARAFFSLNGAQNPASIECCLAKTYQGRLPSLSLIGSSKAFVLLILPMVFLKAFLLHIYRFKNEIVCSTETLLLRELLSCCGGGGGGCGAGGGGGLRVSMTLRAIPVEA